MLYKSFCYIKYYSMHCYVSKKLFLTNHFFYVMPYPIYVKSMHIKHINSVLSLKTHANSTFVNKKYEFYGLNVQYAK